MKKIIAAAMLAAGLIIPVTTAPTAHANTPGCVTWNEFRRATPGHTLLWVEARFDTHGVLNYQGGGYKEKVYRACPSAGPSTARFIVQYRHHHDAWRVEWKSFTRDYYGTCQDC